MDGWQHSTLDYDPPADGAEEAWTRAVALEKALDLNRTFNGVWAKAIREGASSLAP